MDRDVQWFLGVLVAWMVLVTIGGVVAATKASDATPEPDASAETRVTSESGIGLEGFEATFTSDDGGNTDMGLPGFGLVVALVAVFLMALRYR